MPTPVPETLVNGDDLKGSLAFHENLNPEIWDADGEMRLDVRVALLRAALAFYRFLDVQGLCLQDVIFTGSNAAFNYTDQSDLDVHLIADFDSVDPDLAENLFTTKKTLWNASHDIRIKGSPLEMYVEDVSNPVTAKGVYSLIDGRWLREPTPDAPEWDDSAVLAKVECFAERIETLLAGEPDKAEIERLIARLRAMRQAGLSNGGEFSVENLAYKGLRYLGFLDGLFQARTDAENRVLSLESGDTE